MKRIKKIFGVFILAVCFTFAVKANSQATEKLFGIKQIDADQNSVTVSVNENTQTKYYAIEVREVNGNEWRQIGKGVDPDCLKTQALLEPGKSYYLRVRGFSDFYCKDEIVDYTDELEVVTAPDITKMNVTEEKATTESFTVKYSGVKGANCFYLICDGETIGTSDKSTFETSKELSAATSYKVTAYASRKSESGYIAEGSYSNGRSKEYIFKTCPSPIYMACFRLSSFDKKKNIYGFEIINMPKCYGTQLQFATPGGKVKKNIYGVSNYKVSGLINDNFYKYRIRSYVRCGSKKIYSSWSDYKYIGISKKMSCKYIDKTNSLKFEWSKISNASGYDVYISDNDKSGYKKVKSLSADKTSITITKYGKNKLKSGKCYFIKFIPKAKVGNETVTSGIIFVIRTK